VQVLSARSADPAYPGAPQEWTGVQLEWVSRTSCNFVFKTEHDASLALLLLREKAAESANPAKLRALEQRERDGELEDGEDDQVCPPLLLPRRQLLLLLPLLARSRCDCFLTLRLRC